MFEVKYFLPIIHIPIHYTLDRAFFFINLPILIYTFAYSLFSAISLELIISFLNVTINFGGFYKSFQFLKIVPK